MRRLGIVTAAFLLWGLSAGGARAGLYCTSEPSEWPSPYPFIDTLKFLRALPKLAESPLPADAPDPAPSDPNPDTMNIRYRRNMALLEAQAKRNALSDQDRINLSFYYIRYLKYSEAIALLEPLAKKKDFSALANLATAEFLRGETRDLTRAIAHQKEALQVMPEVVAGWGWPQLNALRRRETLFLTLIEYRESRSNPDRPTATTPTLDALFPGVRYETREGEYEAGAIPPQDAAALPLDALALMTQLVIWLPRDNEVFWQFGELLNASGDFLQAYTVIDELVFVRNVDAPSLRKHRAVLRDARSKWYEIAKVWKANDATVPTQLFAVTLARGMPGVPVGGDIGREMGWFATLTATQHPGNPQLLPDAPVPPFPKDLPASGKVNLDWKQILVAFAAGMVISWLLGHQIRQARQGRG